MQYRMVAPIAQSIGLDAAAADAAVALANRAEMVSQVDKHHKRKKASQLASGRAGTASASVGSAANKR